MYAAKFFVIGESNHWLRNRIQEEIQSTGLDGSVLDSGPENLAVFVEGDKKQVKRLYENIREFTPGKTTLSDIKYEHMPETTPGDPKDEVIILIKEIERQVRRMNQKLDALTAKGTIQYTDDEPSESPTIEQYSTRYEDEEDDTEEPANAFSAMFGD